MPGAFRDFLTLLGESGERGEIQERGERGVGGEEREG
jgi:hypothetical protein